VDDLLMIESARDENRAQFTAGPAHREHRLGGVIAARVVL
jgi:hypothetical protein